MVKWSQAKAGLMGDKQLNISGYKMSTAKDLLIKTRPARKLASRPAQMRGHMERSGSLFFYVSIEERISASHPLLRIRQTGGSCPRSAQSHLL
jgi:hypothetical protein